MKVYPQHLFSTGESAQIPDSPASFELLGLLPDSYGLAIKNQYTFTAKSESNFDSDGVVEKSDLLMNGKESLKIQELPSLGPLERTTVNIIQRVICEQFNKAF